MAGVITHIVFAVALLNGPLDHFDPKKFILGTSFPDIRYLGVINRKQTHKENVTWDDVMSQACPFKAGMHFHALIDQLRQAYMKKNQVYEKLPNSPLITHCFKFCEDVLLYDKIDDWDQITHYFDDIIPEQQAYGISDLHLTIWHSLLKLYCRSQPTLKIVKPFLQQCSADHTPHTKEESLEHLVKQVDDLNVAKSASLGFYEFVMQEIAKLMSY